MPSRELSSGTRTQYNAREAAQQFRAIVTRADKRLGDATRTVISAAGELFARKSKLPDADLNPAKMAEPTQRNNSG